MVAIRQEVRMQFQFLSQCIAAAHTANVRGEFASAVSWCRRALQLHPDLPEAWYNLGLAYAGQAKRREAVEALHQARMRTLDSADAQNSIGLQLLHLDALEEAERCLAQALRLVPDFAFAHSNIGMLFEKQKRFGDAEASFRKAIQLQPNLVPSYVNLGGVLNAQERYEEAEFACRSAIELDPHFAAAWSNLGTALTGQKRYEEAEVACRKATQLNPGSSEAWSNLGSALYGQKHYKAAEEACQKSIELDPSAAEAWCNLAAALGGLKRYDAAESACCKAIELSANDQGAWNGLGLILLGQKRYEAAEAACRKAIELNPSASEAWGNLATALEGLKRFETAAECRAKSLQLNPSSKFALGAMVHDRMHCCHWDHFDDDLRRLVTSVERRECMGTPFEILALSTNPSIQRIAAEIYVSEYFPAMDELGAIPRLLPREKIRIGYYSADFHNHATSYLMAELFELHCKERFEIIGFSFGPDKQDEMRQRVSAAFDRFIDVRSLSDKEVAALSRQMEIDIAVDLKGFTEDCRTGIFAYRAAPIQVSYLGYPGTMGAEYIDYVIADRTLIPAEAQKHYSEKVVYLPHSYQVNDSKRKIADWEFTREELGLPPDGFVFSCFNNNYKISPATFGSWMRILKQVDGSVLWLFEANPTATESLRKETAKRGVSPDRLIFAKPLPLAEHLARIRAADLFLDTLPYNAHTTTSDALWAGLPVLTLIGESFAGRVAASLLNAVGLPELITGSSEEYEAFAIRLASCPDELQQVKEKLSKNRLAAPLFDAALFAAHIEAAYVAMYQRYQAGLAPDHLSV